jgi:hypothetical protein
MTTELILIAIVAMFASLSAYAQDAAQDLNEPESGYQQGLCTVAKHKI